MSLLNSAIVKFALEDPSRTAMVFGERQSTYADLDLLSDRISRALLEEGLKPGDRIAVVSRNNDRFFALILAAVRTGICIVPVNWRLAPQEARFILEDCSPGLVIIDRDSAALFNSAGQANSLSRVIGFEDGIDGAEPFDRWLDRSDGAGRDMPEIEPQAAFLQLYTSGTTGRPKGVLLTNDRYSAHLERLRPIKDRWIRCAPEEVVVLAMPNFHISGCAGMEVLDAGGKLVILKVFDPRQLLTAIEEHKGTRIFVVPAALDQMLRLPEIEHADLSSLLNVQYGGSPILPATRALARQHMNCGFAHCYGMTETTGSISVLAPNEHEPADAPRSTSVGRPIAGTEVRIVNAEGQVLGAGQAGEIETRAKSNFATYYHRPDATAEAYRYDWLRTGDVGYLDDEGYLYIRDRLKDMIISGGENIYPLEVENVLNGHPSVAESAVVGLPNSTWGEAVTAYIVLKPGAMPADQEISEWLKPHLAGYKRPKAICFVDVLPRNGVGKVQRNEIRKWGHPAA